MKANYSTFIQRLIDKYEGGYGWDAADAGGPTKYGITCYRLAEHRGQKMTSMAEWAPIVKAMTRAEAETIYKHYYAAPCMFDQMPSGVDCVVLDYGVNSGPTRAMQVGRTILGASSNADLVNKLAALNVNQRKDFISKMCAERLAFMKRIRGGKDWKVFGRGWQARVDDVLAYGLALVAKKTPLPAIDLSDVPTPKAEPTKSNPVKEIAQGTGGTALTTSGGYQISGKVAIALFIAGVVATAIYVFIRNRQAKKEAAIVIPA